MRRSRGRTCWLALLVGSGACRAAYGIDTPTVDEPIKASVDAAKDVAESPAVDAIDANSSSLPKGAVQWEEGNGHHYLVVVGVSAVSWSEARTLAVEAGGHLATLTSADEAAFVEALLAEVEGAYFEGEGPWIGAYQPLPNGGNEPDGGWVWITGEPWEYAGWAEGQPDNGGSHEHYAHFWRKLGWNDGILSGNGRVFSYVVEFE